MNNPTLASHQKIKTSIVCSSYKAPLALVFSKSNVQFTSAVYHTQYSTEPSVQVEQQAVVALAQCSSEHMSSLTRKFVDIAASLIQWIL